MHHLPHNFPGRTAVVLLALAGIALPVLAQVQYTTIALTGQPAPGLTGLTFGTLADPRLSENFTTAFWSQLAPNLATSVDNAIWIDRGTGPVVAAREADAIPDPGIFGLVTPQLSGLGLLSLTIATKQTPTGPTRAAFTTQASPGSPLSIIATEPPQTSSATNTFSFPIPRTDDGQSAYTVSPSSTVPGMLRTAAGNISTGDPAPVAGTTLPVGSLFRRFSPPVMNAAGDMVFRAWAGDTATVANWRQGLWKLSAGSLTPVAIVAEGDLGTEPGSVFTELGPTPQIDDEGRVAFSARLTVNGLPAGGLFRWNGAAVTRLIVAGEALQEGSLHAGVISSRFAMTPAGELAALVPVQEGGPSANAVILRIAPDNTQTIVIREGDQAPGLGAATIGTLLDPRLSSAGGLAFTATIAGDAVRRVGLFAQARQGSAFFPIASIGATFTPPGGTAKTVRDLSFDHEQSPSGLSQFVGRSLVFTLSFTDESNALLRADLPAPEPVADVNLDGQVTLEDFFAFFNAWDASLPPADLDGTPGASLEDFFAFFNSWAG